METFYYLEKALSTLRPAEQKRFEKFLSSAYFHKRHHRNSQLLKFYRILKTRVKQVALQNNILTKKQNSSHSKDLFIEENEIIQKIYPDKKSGYRNQFLKLKSELLSCFLDFLCIESFTRNGVIYKISMLNELNKRNLDDFFWHYCRQDRFDDLNSKPEEPGHSYYVWQLVRALNIHKAKSIESSSCQLLFDKGNTDYDIEKHVLIKYFKKELSDLQSRYETIEPEILKKHSIPATKKPQVFQPTA